MADLCFFQMPSGARCTMPKGHSGDHIAESGRKGNIIDTARGGGGGAQEVKVRGSNCAVVGVVLIGGLIGVGYTLAESISSIL
jgi:hypothetical protein